MRCAVAGCNTDNQSKKFTKDLMLFRFPNNEDLIKQWVIACKRSDKINVKNARVCSKHFDVQSYERNLKFELLGYSARNRRLLKRDSVPFLNLPVQRPKNVNGIKNRNERVNKRNRTKLVEGILQTSGVEIKADVVDVPISGGRDTQFNICTNMDISGDEIETDVIAVPISGGRDTQFHDCTNRVISLELDERDETIAKLKQEVEELKNENQIFKTIFTPAQIRKLKNKNKRATWTIDDISKAIVIHSAGARAYRLLRKKGYPLPAVSTLRAWCKKIQLNPGILKKVFMIVKQADLQKVQKLCVLSFDEMKVRNVYLYDKLNDETLKPYNYVQVATLRGLVGNWKQPIFYDFDCKMSKEKLFEIITYAENAGFPVVAVVSDLGGGNRSLHKELNINTQQTWFINPASNQKTYVFADVPHLIKLLRNHYVDDGFILNGKEINRGIIEKLIQLTSSTDLNIAHKISMDTLHVKGPQRQKVKLATKLFSHTISRAITRCGIHGEFKDENWLQCADFFKLVNDWFDCLNVRVPEEDSRERKKAFGLSLDVQTKILDEMTDIISSLRVKGKKSLLPFQNGIIITNTSLKLLYDDLKTQYNIKYILTYRLNQDILENFFGAIRSKGGLHDHPNALEFKYRLRAYILGRNEGSLSDEGNTEIDDTPDLQPGSEQLLSGQCFSKLTPPPTHNPKDSLISELDQISYDGLENLAGFICHKLKCTEPTASTLSQQSFTWVDHLSEGGLSKPSAEMMQHIEELEKIFESINSDKLLIGKGYLNSLLNHAIDIKCSRKIKQLFFRSRMYFRIKRLNKDLQDKSWSKKRKMSKITK